MPAPLREGDVRGVLEGLFDSAPVGIAIIGRDLRFRAVNAWLARRNGRPVAEHIGRSMAEVLPDLAEAVDAALRRVFENGEDWVEVELARSSNEVRHGTRWSRVRFHPIRDAQGNVTSAGAFVTDSTRRRRAEAVLAGLQKMAFALSRASSREEVVRTLVDVSCEVIGAHGCCLYSVESGNEPRLMLEACSGDGLFRTPGAAGVALDDGNPLGLAATARTAVWIDSAEEIRARFPEWVRTAAPGVEALAALPLWRRGQDGRARTVGVLAFRFDEPRDFDARTQELILAFTHHSTDVLERVRAFEKVRASAARFQALQEVTAQLARATTTQEVAARISVEAAASVHASQALLLTVEGGVLHAVAGAGVEPRSCLLTALAAPAEVARTGLPIVWERWSGYCERFPGAAETPFGPRGARAFYPVEIDGRVAGVFALAFDGDRNIDGEEREFLAALAGQCALALQRVASFEAERRARRTAEDSKRHLDVLIENLALAKRRTEMAAARSRLLSDASRIFAERGIDITGALDRVVLSLVSAGAADLVSVRFLSGDETRLLPAVSHPWEEGTTVNELREELARFPIDVTQEPFATAMRTQHAAVMEHPNLDRLLAESERRNRFQALIRERSLTGLMVVPLRARGQVLGTIGLLRIAPTPPFAPEDVDLAQELADRAALALDNARLFEASEEANRRKDEFLAMLAHELRNPMAPLLSAVALLAGDIANAEQGHRARAVIDRQVRHMAHLVDDLLEVSRISRGKIELRRSPIDLSALLREVAADQRAIAAAGGIELEVSLPEEPEVVLADRTRLAQVLTNLLGNAFKFTPPQGRVTISLSRVDGEAEIAVTDTGVGIDAELIPTIFEPFTQGDRSLDRAKGGLGLGLALVRGIVALHGGSASVESEGRGKGATFRVRIPRSPGAETTVRAPSTHAPSPAPVRRRVLVVDDNRDAADMLCDLLTEEGHEVSVAYDGSAAVSVAHTQAPDVILCDLGLPGKDGFAVAREIRQDSALAKTRLYAVTGYGAEEDRRRAREAGFDGHLTKPVDLAALERVLSAP